MSSPWVAQKNSNGDSVHIPKTQRKKLFCGCVFFVIKIILRFIILVS